MHTGGRSETETQTKKRRAAIMGSLFYVNTGNRHGQTLVFETAEAAKNWLKAVTSWSDEQIAENIHEAKKGAAGFFSIWPH